MNVTIIKPTDVFLVSAPVGNLPSAKIEPYLETIKAKIKQHFDNEVLIIASQSPTLTVEVLRKE